MITQEMYADYYGFTAAMAALLGAKPGKTATGDEIAAMINTAALDALPPMNIMGPDNRELAQRMILAAAFAGFMLGRFEHVD
jgi:hypothetical protein